MARFQHHLQVEDFAADSGRAALEALVRDGQLDPDSDRIAREWLDIDGELLSRRRWFMVLAVCVVLIAGTAAVTPFLA